MIISTSKFFKDNIIARVHKASAIMLSLKNLLVLISTPNCIEKLLPEQDSFKMLYVSHATTLTELALQRFHFVDCGQ